MMSQFEQGILAVIIVLLFSSTIFVGGYAISRVITRNDINLCGHTLECFEKVVFPSKEK